MSLRNIAIVAHVDHGKTTLVDGLLRQSGVFREGAQVAERVMDSNDQERERGITIVSKNTAVLWNDVRINIVDTPGHADFGSEVERVLKTVDAVLLLVDAAEGPMPQTRFVLRKSLALGLKVLVVINKIDRKDARSEEVLDEIFDLMVNLGASDEQLDFPLVYASARAGYAMNELEQEAKDLEPLFQMILDHVPEPQMDPNGPLQFQVATLDYSPYLGRIAVGRVFRGTIRRGLQAVICKHDGSRETFRVSQLMTFHGLERLEVEEVAAGDIVALSGAGTATVGDTICPADAPDPLPVLAIDEPTVSMSFLPNTSPFAGQEGRFVTSRQIRERLQREAIANVGLRIEPGTTPDSFIVSGRGILHLSVLIETMRREGYELSISQPRVILKELDGVTEEPFEDVSVDCEESYSGTVIEKLNQRGGELRDLRVDADGHSRMSWILPSRGLIGYRSEFLTDSRGTGTLSHVFSHYAPTKLRRAQRGNGVMLVQENVTTVAYALANLQERGQLIVEPGVDVYAGQVIGIHSRDNDLVVNPAKGKKLTNMRASGTDDTVRLTPPRVFSLEEALEFIADDELLEVTPTKMRIRKRILDHNERKRSRHKT
jgi:GTP-binding protein